MANYANSLLVNAQAMLAESYQKPEFRHRDYALTKVVIDNATNLLPELNQIKTSDQRTVDTFALTHTASDAVTARAHNHSAAAFGDSQKVTLSFSTIGQEFKTSLKMADRNFLTASQMLMARLNSAWIHALDTLEAAIATSLNTNKSQVNGATDSELGTWDTTNYKWDVPAANETLYFASLASFMRQNKYAGLIDCVNDPQGYVQANKIGNQGGGNANNLAWQLSGLNIIESINLSHSAGEQASCYLIPKDTVGLVTWIPTLNREGKETKDYTYTNMFDPFGLGIQAAIHIREVGADNSSTVGETQDVTIEYEMTFDYDIVYAPISTSNAATVFKGVLLT